jgi:hypothetical protein
MRRSPSNRATVRAFGHLKAIGASKAAKALLDKAGVTLDEGWLV